MATEANTTAAATPAAAKPKTTGEGMTAYRTFDSPADATAYLEKCGADFADFGDQTFAFAKINDDGEYDPEVYTDSMRVRVAVLKNRNEVKGQPSTVKAIVVGPVPTLDSLLSDDAGRAWVQKVIDKELNHVLVRPLRDAENLDVARESMPTTREAFITSSRDTGGIMDAYNELYPIISDKMKAAPVWQKARLVKAELKKAMESKAYALEYYSAVEDRGEGKESLFVTALRFGQALAAHKGADSAIFDKWLATRDNATLKASDADDSADDLDLDDLVSGLTSDEDSAEEGTEGAPAA